MSNLEYLYQLAQGGSWHGKLAEMQLQDALGDNWEEIFELLNN